MVEAELIHRNARRERFGLFIGFERLSNTFALDSISGTIQFLRLSRPEYPLFWREALWFS
jgi:hypothetical protein